MKFSKKVTRSVPLVAAAVVADPASTALPVLAMLAKRVSRAKAMLASWYNARRCAYDL
jgi:hypothetical protein